MDYSRKSKIWIGAPCTLTVPGTVVRVVKSISETSECVPVSFDINVDCCIGELGDVKRNNATDLPDRRETNETNRSNARSMYGDEGIGKSDLNNNTWLHRNLDHHRLHLHRWDL